MSSSVEAESIEVVPASSVKATGTNFALDINVTSTNSNTLWRRLPRKSETVKKTESMAAFAWGDLFGS